MENSRMSLAERELEIPVSEPERQYYFIDRARKDLEKMKEAAGRQLTFCVTTFGCQMNARDSEKLAILSSTIRAQCVKMQISACTEGLDSSGISRRKTRT